MSDMKIRSYLPQSSTLKSLIKCFYVLEQNEISGTKGFLILPSVSAYLSISQNTKSFIENERIIVKAGKGNSLDSSVQLGLKNSTVYEYRGKFREVCVVFNPLAIFDFFTEKELLKPKVNNLQFIPDNTYEKIINKILSFSDDEIMLAKLEKYLLSRFLPFSHQYLPQAINDLVVTDTEKNLSLNTIAKKYGVTRQTLDNNFKKFVNLSASEFKQICRFRKFIEAKLIDEKNSRMTDFVYDFGFFDQSHLIKEFKKYTFLKPNDFFRKIDNSKDNRILVIWQ